MLYRFIKSDFYFKRFLFCLFLFLSANKLNAQCPGPAGDCDGDEVLDYIDLDTTCDWSGFSKSEYLSHIKNSSRFTHLKFLDKYESENIDITKYETDKKCEFYLIAIYGNGEEIFITDKNGAITSDIVKDLDLDMKVAIKNSCDNTTMELKYSIIKNNFFYKYFKKEKNDKSEILWILEK